MPPPLDRLGLSRLLRWDEALSGRLARPVRGGAPRLLALIVAHSGDSQFWLAGGIAALLWGGAAWRPFGLRVVVGTFVAATVATLLKWLFRRHRPPGPAAGLYLQLDRHGFPSGHATRGGCLVVLLAPLVPPWAAVLLATWAVTLALTRVALGVHYLSDVGAGLGVGAVLGLVLLAGL